MKFSICTCWECNGNATSCALLVIVPCHSIQDAVSGRLTLRGHGEKEGELKSNLCHTELVEI
jgi:hypothetical protein